MKKLKVNFYLKGDKKNADGNIAIYAKIYLGNQYSTFSTSKYISKVRWEKTSNLRNPLRIDNEVSLKSYLESLEKSIIDKYTELQKDNSITEEITPLYLKNHCFNPNSEEKLTLLDIISKHNNYFKKQVLKGDRAKGSLEKYERMKDVISEYLQLKYKLKDIPFEKVNRQFVFGLDEYLRFERKHGGKSGLANNTTVKYIRNISSIVSHSKTMGLVSDNPFSIYDKSLNEVDTVYLTLEELKKIETKQISNRRLDVVRDIFLFSCYTSYAPVDVMNLRKGNYSLDSDLDSWIHTKRQKTGVKTNVLVIPPLKRIIEKYKDDPECTEENRLVPNRSNSNMNAYLKEIADLCGIEKNLTWYVGRHTFATTVALANNIPMEVISQIMGHKRITQTQHYAKLLDGTVKQHMKGLSENFI
ncbi:phage integrase SAM-like domain-containing protein [Flavobacterium pectinovorum]|uniref:site-specific integrase n=1 Tax=Flavobacterium pectinovorum TaxID=29533 RepID=UPI00265DF1F7|nr:site-specific integrase [Flavobacterium pectinovorum]WKL47836.1 phage integrase SAM-like domain-containing protein [Flavobacterium pectinovorum]